MDPRQAAWREGSRDMLEVALGVIAWALVTGVAMAQSTLTTPQAVVLSLMAFAGSAQLAVIPLMAVKAPVWLIILTALVVNLRFVIYSAGLAKPLSHLSLGRRAILSYITGDMPFALYMQRTASDPTWPARDAYYAGMVVTNWWVWHISVLAGIALGARIPHEWGLELAGSLALLALVIPMAIKRLSTLVGVGAAVAVALLTYRFPMRLGVIVAIVAGVMSSLVIDWLVDRRLPQVTI